MSAAPRVIISGYIEEDGTPLPEVVQIEGDRLTEATYAGIETDPVNPDRAVYDMGAFEDDLKIPLAAVTDEYDVVERVGERAGYRDNKDQYDADGLEPLSTGRENASSENSVDALLDSDELDPL